MTELERVLADVFERGAEARIADAEEEARLIAAARDGDEGATVRLVYAYAPVLRDAVKRYTFTPAVWDGATIADRAERDEAQSVALLGFMEAIHAHDPAQGDRLAGIVSQYVDHAMGEAMADVVPVRVPSRSLTRFYAILNRAGRDVEAAAALAPSFAMKRETFLAIAQAVRAERLEGAALTEEGAERLDGSARSIWDDADALAEAEDRIMVEAAFGVVDGLEKDVTRAAYGFSGYRPLSDGEIAEEGWAGSRASVQRTRTRALGKMRDALGL